MDCAEGKIVIKREKPGQENHRRHRRATISASGEQSWPSCSNSTPIR